MNDRNKTNKEAWNAHAGRYFEENKLTVNQVDYCGQYYGVLGFTKKTDKNS